MVRAMRTVSVGREAVVELRVLGPLEAFRDGRRLHLSRRQQRLVLGVLALEANKLVTSDRLIELMWGQSPPHRVRAIIQTRISELRSALQGSDTAPDDIELISLTVRAVRP